MAQFTEKKVVFSEINGGNEYTEQDGVQPDAINAAIEGAAYAQTKSDEAVETATSAENTANGIADTANLALTNSQTAMSNALNALTQASSANENTTKILNGTTTVPNAQHAVSADSADLATKAKQDVNGNSIVDTYATKNEVAEKQGTKVYYGSALQTSVAFDSDPQAQITANKSDINDIVSGAQTVEKAKADQKGNIIDTTYAKLSQVVRTDAAQSLTDEEKTRAKDNLVIQTEKGNSTSITRGWYRVAKLTRNTVYTVVFGEAFNYNSPSNAKLILNIGYSTAVITQCGIRFTRFTPNRIRTCVDSSDDVFFDIYIPDTNVNNVAIYIEKLYIADGNPHVDTYDDWEYLGTDDTVSGYNVTLLDLVGGINTTGTIYQQGAPVFATDPSKLVPSTANGWTQTTATGTLPSAGIYMITFDYIPGTSQPAYYYPAILIYDGTLGTCTVTDNTGALLVSMVVNPSGIRLVDPVNIVNQVQSTNIYYKRIA